VSLRIYFEVHASDCEEPESEQCGFPAQGSTIMTDEGSTDTVARRPAGSSAAGLGQLPVVAIVGRPNAGKSLLFNRLIHGQRAIVDSQPGVTRDRNIAVAHWQDRAFLLVDTGGFEDRDASALAAAVRAQGAQAAEEADLVIALFDGREGLNPTDRDFVQRLRRLRKPVLIAVNKLDTPTHEDAAAEFFALGAEEVLPISAAHGLGVAALMDRVVALLPEPHAPREHAGEAVTLAIVGRPNVGKSSLLNRLVGHERAVVDATPGTTRDPVDIPFCHGGKSYVFVDTAGIRRRPRVHEQIERSSVVRALRALARADVALLVLDATEGMRDQDARIAGYAWERGRALLLVINKWDAVPRARRDRPRVLGTIHRQYPTLAEVPAVFVSARTGAHLDELFPALENLLAAHHRVVRTVHLNQVLEAAARAQAPPSSGGKRPRFFYATQTGTAPPSFTVFCNHPELVATAYERYLANAFREAFDLRGTPLRLRLRARRRQPS
jgi:GTP-binding protein